MALGIYLGGTTGLADGTLEVPGDGSGLTLGAIGSVGTLHIRAASGKQNAEQVTVNAPTNCEVSADGITYAATAVYAIGAIQDTNVAIYVKRTAGTNALTTGGTTTPRLSLITEEAIAVPDTTAPVLGGTLVATAGDTQVTLSGPTATDAVGIAKWQYRIGTGAWVDIANSASGTMPSTVVGGLVNGTVYSFTVRALDAAGNASDASNAATATPADTTAPTIAGSLTATPTAVQGQVALSGPTATDNVGIAKWQYQVDAGAWVDVASTATTFPSTNVSSLSIGSHNFAVRALDAAGNASDTKTASATVADITAPVLSGTLVATAGDTQVTLSGPTATDAVGIAKWQYRIGTGAWVDIAESNNTTMPSTVVGSLINGTEYSFTVRALDAAGNASTASNAATATPAATHTDDFAGAAIDAAKWDVTTAGNGSVGVSGGVCTLSGSATTDGQLIWSKPTRAYNAVKTTRSKFKLASSGLGTGATFISLGLFDSPTAVVPNNQTTSNIFNIPVAASPATQDTTFLRIVFGVYEVSGACKLRILRGVPFGESPDLGRFWNGTAWAATVTNFDAAFDTYYVAKLETTATQYRASFLSADETSTIATTGWRDWTEIRTFESPTACRFIIGDTATNVHYGTLVLDWFDER